MFPDVTFRLEIVPTHLTKHCLESIFYMDYHIDCDCIVKCVETFSRIIVTPGNRSPITIWHPFGRFL